MRRSASPRRRQRRDDDRGAPANTAASAKYGVAAETSASSWPIMQRTARRRSGAVRHDSRSTLPRLHRADIRFRGLWRWPREYRRSLPERGQHAHAIGAPSAAFPNDGRKRNPGQGNNLPSCRIPIRVVAARSRRTSGIRRNRRTIPDHATRPGSPALAAGSNARSYLTGITRCSGTPTRPRGSELQAPAAAARGGEIEDRGP